MANRAARNHREDVLLCARQDWSDAHIVGLQINGRKESLKEAKGDFNMNPYVVGGRLLFNAATYPSGPSQNIGRSMQKASDLDKSVFQLDAEPAPFRLSTSPSCLLSFSTPYSVPAFSQRDCNLQVTCPKTVVQVFFLTFPVARRRYSIRHDGRRRRGRKKEFT